MVEHQGSLDIEAACSPVKGDLVGPERFSIGGTPQQAVKKKYPIHKEDKTDFSDIKPRKYFKL